MIRWLKNLFRGGLAYGPVTRVPHVCSYIESGKGLDTDEHGKVTTCILYKCSGCGLIYISTEYRDKHGQLIQYDVSTAELTGDGIRFKPRDPAQPSPPGVSN